MQRNYTKQVSVFLDCVWLSWLANSMACAAGISTAFKKHGICICYCTRKNTHISPFIFGYEISLKPMRFLKYLVL